MKHKEERQNLDAASAKARDDRARRRLHRYHELASAWGAMWGIPMDKTAFLNLWAQARKETA